MNVAAQSMASCCADLYELPIVEYLLGNSLHPGGEKLTRQLASATLVSPGSNVLDVACGNGSSARIVAADFGASVTGCDYSGVNLQRAKNESCASGRGCQTQFVRGSAGQLPFRQQTFDAAICECSLCLFADIDNALEQIHLVLKPGGHVGISDFFLNAPVPENLDGLLGRVLCVAGARSPDGYRKALMQAGFEHVRIRIVNWTLTAMIKRIRQGLELLDSAILLSETVLPADWGDPLPVLTGLEDFIAGGGAGYLIATARRPGTSATGYNETAHP